MVEMHTAATRECDTLRAQLTIAKSKGADESRRTTNIETVTAFTEKTPVDAATI